MRKVPIMRSPIFSLILLVIFVLALTGCGHIEDTNGNDTSLVTFSMEDLAGKSISRTQSGVSTVSERNRITINTQFEEIDLDYLELSGGITSGISNLMATELKAGQSLTIACESGVKSGNLAIVLISPDSQILHEFPTGKYDEVTITAETDGKYFIRSGCESFTGVILLSRDF